MTSCPHCECSLFKGHACEKYECIEAERKVLSGKIQDLLVENKTQETMIKMLETENGKMQNLLVKNKTQGIMIKMLETEKQENREEEVEEVESQVVEMEQAEVEVEATPSVPSTNFRVMDMYLHKVLGYPPWPVQVSHVEGDKISVVYYGTGEVATLRKAAHSKFRPFAEEIVQKLGLDKNAKLKKALQEARDSSE